MRWSLAVIIALAALTFLLQAELGRKRRTESGQAETVVPVTVATVAAAPTTAAQTTGASAAAAAPRAER